MAKLEYSLEFTLPGLPKTFNQLAKKNAHRIKQSERRKWFQMVGYALSNKRPREPLRKAHLKLIRHSSSAPDYDGLVCSFKFVIDALVEGRVIRDDTMRVIGMPDFTWEPTSRGKGFISVAVAGVVE